MFPDSILYPLIEESISGSSPWSQRTPRETSEKSSFIGAVDNLFSRFRLIAQEIFFSRKILFLRDEIH